jgi:hypothetical protein
MQSLTLFINTQQSRFGPKTTPILRPITPLEQALKETNDLYSSIIKEEKLANGWDIQRETLESFTQTTSSPQCEFFPLLPFLNTAVQVKVEPGPTHTVQMPPVNMPPSPTSPTEMVYRVKIESISDSEYQMNARLFLPNRLSNGTSHPFLNPQARPNSHVPATKSSQSSVVYDPTTKSI